MASHLHLRPGGAKLTGACPRGASSRNVFGVRPSHAGRQVLAPCSMGRQHSSTNNSRRSLQCFAAAKRKQLPIFPLNVVALPHAVVPLMIFEAR